MSNAWLLIYGLSIAIFLVISAGTVLTLAQTQRVVEAAAFVISSMSDSTAGPAVGQVLPPVKLGDLEVPPLLAPGRRSSLVLLSPGCPACGQVIAALQAPASLTTLGDDVFLIIGGRDSQHQVSVMRAQLPPHIYAIADEQMLSAASWGVRSVPFVIGTDHTGMVLGAGSWTEATTTQKEDFAQ